MAERWLITWYSASSSSAWDVSKMLTSPSVLEERRSVAWEGWSCREVMVSVWDSIRDNVGAEGLRWSLVHGQLGVKDCALWDMLPNVDGRYAGSIVGVFDAGCDEVLLCVADEGGDELVGWDRALVYCLTYVVWENARLSISRAFCRVLLSQNRILPSLPAVATTLLGASFARSRHVTLSFTFLITPEADRFDGSRNRSESSDDIMANWSSFEYVSGSCRGAVEMIL